MAAGGGDAGRTDAVPLTVAWTERRKRLIGCLPRSLARLDAMARMTDAASYLGYAPHVTEELGDVLWYLAAVAKRGGLTLSELAAEIPRTGASAGSAGELRFQDLQPASAASRPVPDPCFRKNAARPSRRGWGGPRRFPRGSSRRMRPAIEDLCEVP
jgi:MazG nucleotide pyrophosphohydrolase domain